METAERSIATAQPAMSEMEILVQSGLAPPAEGILNAPYLGLLAWQIEYGKAVCLHCKVTIGGSKNSIRRHFLVQHQQPTPTAPTGISNQLNHWKAQFEDVPIKKVTNDLIIDRPIEGLRVEKAFMCGSCSKTALSAKTVRNHCAIAKHDPKRMKPVNASIYSLKKPPIPIIDRPPHFRNAIEAVSSRALALSETAASSSSSAGSRSLTVNEFIAPIEVSPLYSKLLRWFALPDASSIGDYKIGRASC